jgi:hypothetical protein
LSSTEPNETTWRITTKGYCAALVVRDGVVVQGAPILRAFVGMYWTKVRYELRRRNHQIDFENLSGGADHDEE